MFGAKPLQNLVVRYYQLNHKTVIFHEILIEFFFEYAPKSPFVKSRQILRLGVLNHIFVNVVTFPDHSTEGFNPF